MATLLAAQNVAQNSKSCQNVTEDNLYRPWRIYKFLFLHSQYYISRTLVNSIVSVRVPLYLRDGEKRRGADDARSYVLLVWFTQAFDHSGLINHPPPPHQTQPLPPALRTYPFPFLLTRLQAGSLLGRKRTRRETLKENLLAGYFLLHKGCYYHIITIRKSKMSTPC